MAKHHS